MEGVYNHTQRLLLRLRYSVLPTKFAWEVWVSHLQLITYQNWKCVHAIFWCQFIPWIPEFLPYTVCYLILVRCGQDGLKRFRKDGKRWQKIGKKRSHGLGRNGVCKRQVTLYLQFYGSES